MRACVRARARALLYICISMYVRVCVRFQEGANYRQHRTRIYERVREVSARARLMDTGAKGQRVTTDEGKGKGEWRCLG